MKIMILLHIISAIAAFGPALAFPLMLRSGIQASGSQVVKLSKGLVTPGLVGLIVFGFGAAGMSDGAIQSSDMWVMLALIVTIIALGVLWGVVIPGITKAVSLEGPAAEAAMRKFAPAIGIVHLCMAVGLYLMLWKPA